METKTFCDMLDKLKISLHRDADGYYMRDNEIADGGKLESERYDDVLIIAIRLDPYVEDYYINDLKKDIADSYGLVISDNEASDAGGLAKYIEDHEALKTAYSHEYDVLKLVSSPAELDKIDLDTVVQHFDPYKVKNTYIYFDKDLENCSDSLLFDSDEGIAVAYFADGYGNKVEMELIVTGEVNVSYKDVIYTTPSDFPADLVDIIKAGDVWYHDDVSVNSNNWFELVFTVKNAEGEEIAYDGDVWESDLTKMSGDDLQTKLRDYADYLLDRYKNQLTHSENTHKPSPKQELKDKPKDKTADVER